MIRILGIGGGNGLPALLRGLRDLSGAAQIGISAIVCVTDNGGSSGRLRAEFDIPAVGDLRNCLVALAGRPSPLAEVFQHRFQSNERLDGHSLGNLIVAALCQTTGSLRKAAEIAGQFLHVRGRVLPASETPLVLCAEMEDGSIARGECQIATAGLRIQHIWLEPQRHEVSSEALEAIAAADTIVLGPGSLYTSILPNLLIPAIADAIRRSPALKLFVCNLMTQPGETQGFNAADHLRVVESYLGRGLIDICLLNSRPIPSDQEHAYSEAGACAVAGDADEISEMGAVPVSADLVDESELRVRHDPRKLAGLVLALTRGAFRARDIICGRGMIAA